MEHFEAVSPLGPAWMVMGSNPVSPSTYIACNTGKYMIAPLGSNVCFLGYGPTSSAAQTNAVNLALITGAAQNCIPIAWSGSLPRVFSLAPNLFFSGLTATGTGTAPIIIIPADGI